MLVILTEECFRKPFQGASSRLEFESPNIDGNEVIPVPCIVCTHRGQWHAAPDIYQGVRPSAIELSYKEGDGDWRNELTWRHNKINIKEGRDKWKTCANLIK